jgi:hypothetical protein
MSGAETPVTKLVHELGPGIADASARIGQRPDQGQELEERARRSVREYEGHRLGGGRVRART